jgi:tetratricopeptide (TPR) repeat protein
MQLFPTTREDSRMQKKRLTKRAPSATPYDNFQIENLNAIVEHADGHNDASLRSYEAMASNVAAPQSDRPSIYASCIALNAVQKNFWRAIQYGRLSERMHLLNAEGSTYLAQIYYSAGLYADSERRAQTALAAGVTDAKVSAELQKLFKDSQVKTGERAQDTGEQVARGFFGAILGGVATGLTGQVVTPDVGIRTQDQAKAEAPTYAAKAGQLAAAESIATDPSLERVVYTDLLAAQVSPRDKKRAAVYFNAASDFYGKENYAAAESNLRKTLDIDPRNPAANYYYADCLARLNGDPIDVVDYLTRAVVFGAGDENANMAKTALQGLATPSAG